MAVYLSKYSSFSNTTFIMTHTPLGFIDSWESLCAERHTLIVAGWLKVIITITAIAAVIVHTKVPDITIIFNGMETLFACQGYCF